LPDKIPIRCSRNECQNENPVVKRWFAGVGPYPVLVVYLCDKCKEIQLWTEDITKEENIS